MMCFAEEPSMQMQMLDNEIERLTKQRDEKFAALQKCEETTKGFKISGIATLAATGVGIYGNIKLAEKLKGNSNSRGKNGQIKELSVVEHVRAVCRTQKELGNADWKNEDCDAIPDNEETRKWWEEYKAKNN